MVWAISDCPGTEQNINIKVGIYNFQKVGVWVQVLSRVALHAGGNKNLDIGRYFYGIYIFVIFNAVTSSVTWPERTEVWYSLLKFTTTFLQEYF